MEKDKLVQGLELSLGIATFVTFFYYRYKAQKKSTRIREKRRKTWLDTLGEATPEQISIDKSTTRGLKPPKTLSAPYGKVLVNPMLGEGVKCDVTSGQNFLPEHLFDTTQSFILADSVIWTERDCQAKVTFVKAGPRKEIVMDPKRVKAGIVTAGGLCPGTNVVIREIVMSLHYNYGTEEVYGITNGFAGFYTPGCCVKLIPEEVKDLHTLGGTFLKTSRGGWDLDKICTGIVSQSFNQLYIVGGDGTHLGIMEIVKELEQRNYPCFIAGIPKTIDNDIPIIDKSFGFETAVEEAQRAINSANVEANSINNGIGLVKLMGRSSGFIALQSATANRNVNVCLIPESEFELSGPNGLYEYIVERLRYKKHAVVVVAEGSASACQDQILESSGKDASGNPVLYDIGAHLKKGIPEYCRSAGIEVTLKYIDPTYMIRSVPANSYDKVLCATLSQAAVHGLFAGFTGFTVGTVGGRTAYIPIDYLVNTSEGKDSKSGQRKVDVDGDMMWWRLMASTGQPSFRN